MKTATTTTVSNEGLGTTLKKGLLKVEIIIVIAFLSFISSTLRSSTPNNLKYDSLACLEIEGMILKSAESSNSDCIVELITNDGKIDTIMLNGNKRKFKVTLNKNMHYAIRISMEGHVSKLISVDTEMFSENDVIHRFAFETALLKEEALVHLDTDAVEMPIAIVHFDHENECFVHSKEYTRNIKNEMRKTKSFNKKGELIKTRSKVHASDYTN